MADKLTDEQIDIELATVNRGSARKLGSVEVDFNVRAQRTGFTSFNHHMLVRAQRPDLCVIAARPGNGKTSFLVQILRNLTKAGEGTTLMFSLEMATTQLMHRALASELKVPMEKLQYLDPARLKTATHRIEAENFYVDDTAGIHINTLHSFAREWHKISPLAAVGIDYIQIVNADGGDMRAQVGNVARGLKAMAKELNVPVIALAQMNRNIETRQANSKSARPTMSDLQECSLVENWADQIVFLDGAWRRDPLRQGEIDVYVAKNRHGRTGEFVLKFEGETMTFSDVEEGI